MAAENSLACRARRRGMVAACLTILCLALLAPGPAALAQGSGAAPSPAELRIQLLRVQVMPEFDNPRVLVVVHGRLPDSVALPAKVTFRLPLEATINQMAVMSLDGDTIAEDYEAVPDAADPRWLAVSYTLTSAHFFYEYYYDPLPDHADKKFSFALSSPYAIDDLLLEVQQPARSSNFQVEPHAGSVREDGSLGLTYHQIQVGAVAAGEEVVIAVRYTKADATPSLSWQQVMALEDAQAPARPATTAPSGRQAGSGSMVALLAGAGLALLVLGIAYATWRAPRPTAAGGQSRARYCRVCGTPQRTGALFCHSCGAPNPTPRHPDADAPQRDGAGCSPLEARL